MSGEPKVSASEEPPAEGANERSEGAVDEEVRRVPEGEAEKPPEREAKAAPQTKTARSQRARASGKKGSRQEEAREGERPEPLAGAYHVALPTFEGPLDLLLHLIQQHELDIRDIPILFVSQKYVEYIMLMQELNIDLASEYLVMAATLAHIKSKMLLPKPPVDQEDDPMDDLDPRSELVRRLLEYQKYKNAAEQLGAAPVLGRDVFVRGAPAPMVDGPAELAQVSVFKLFDAFQKLLSRAVQHADHMIDVDRISISERIIELTDLLRGRGRVRFETLFDETMTRSDLIVSFLALLEMTRLRMMLVLQEGPLQPIEMELTLGEEHDEILARGPDGPDPLTALSRGDVDAAIGKPERSEALATEGDSASDAFDDEPQEVQDLGDLDEPEGLDSEPEGVDSLGESAEDDLDFPDAAKGVPASRSEEELGDDPSSGHEASDTDVER